MCYDAIECEAQFYLPTHSWRNGSIASLVEDCALHLYREDNDDE